jgi:hypothetical protein
MISIHNVQLPCFIMPHCQFTHISPLSSRSTPPQYPFVRPADFVPSSWPRKAAERSAGAIQSDFHAGAGADFWAALNDYLASLYPAAEAAKVALECRRQYAALLTRASQDQLAMFADEASVVVAAAAADAKPVAASMLD